MFEEKVGKWDEFVNVRAMASLHKNRDREDMDNFRGRGVSGVCCGVLGRVIAEHMG